jgi:hypothetical protein
MPELQSALSKHGGRNLVQPLRLGLLPRRDELYAVRSGQLLDWRRNLASDQLHAVRDEHFCGERRRELLLAVRVGHLHNSDWKHFVQRLPAWLSDSFWNLH